MGLDLLDDRLEIPPFTAQPDGRRTNIGLAAVAAVSASCRLPSYQLSSHRCWPVAEVER